MVVSKGGSVPAMREMGVVQGDAVTTFISRFKRLRRNSKTGVAVWMARSRPTALSLAGCSSHCRAIYR